MQVGRQAWCARMSKVFKGLKSAGRSQNVQVIGRPSSSVKMFGAQHHVPRLCWLKPEGNSSQPQDEQTWIVKHDHVAVGSKTPISLTIGNKRYALSAVAEPAGNDAKSKYPSEASLYKKYS